MKVIKSGNKLSIFPNASAIVDSIPSGTFEVNFSPFEGFYLRQVSNFTEPEHKVYGDVDARIERIQKRHVEMAKLNGSNTGAILSGIKGSGKSILLRKYGVKAVNGGVPVILVNDFVPGVGNFISSIQQSCVFIFDEFEKTFKESEMQNELLTIIDGASNKNGHLYLFAINAVGNVSDYLFNRPGRVHYHFKYNLLEEDIVLEYLTDNIKDKSRIDDAVDLAKRMYCTFDVLQALCWEINAGYTTEEISNGLNSSIRYEFNIVCEMNDKSVGIRQNTGNRSSITVRLPVITVPNEEFLDENGNIDPEEKDYNKDDKDQHDIVYGETFDLRGVIYVKNEDGDSVVTLDPTNVVNNRRLIVDRIYNGTCFSRYQAEWIFNQIKEIKIDYSFHVNHAAF